jgi:hypothetical protein
VKRYRLEAEAAVEFDMFDMLQLVGEIGKKRLLMMQERRYLSLRKVSILSLDDKLKLVGHSG